jgi:predicted HTH domain antitoxin
MGHSWGKNVVWQYAKREIHIVQQALLLEFLQELQDRGVQITENYGRNNKKLIILLPKP